MHTIKFGAVEQTKQIFWLGKTITWQQIVFKIVSDDHFMGETT